MFNRESAIYFLDQPEKRSLLSEKKAETLISEGRKKIPKDTCQEISDSKD
jgi:hypothetical protein